MNVKVELSDSDLQNIAKIAAQLAVELFAARFNTSLPQADGVNDRNIPEAELAKRLGIKSKTLATWRRKGLVISLTATRPVVYTAEQAKAAEQVLIDTGRARDARQVAINGALQRK